MRTEQEGKHAGTQSSGHRHAGEALGRLRTTAFFFFSRQGLHTQTHMGKHIHYKHIPRAAHTHIHAHTTNSPHTYMSQTHHTHIYTNTTNIHTHTHIYHKHTTNIHHTYTCIYTQTHMTHTYHKHITYTPQTYHTHTHEPCLNKQTIPFTPDNWVLLSCFLLLLLI